MADINQIQVGTTTYDIADTIARNSLTTKADKTELNNYVSKSGDVMNATLSIQTFSADVTSVPSTLTNRFFKIVDKNAEAFSLFGGAQFENGDVYNTITAQRKNQNNQNIQNYLYLITTSTGTRSIQIPNDSNLKTSWRNALGADSNGSWPISMGGTGATTYTNAVMNLFNNQNVGTSTTHFLTFGYYNGKWEKIGYTNIANARTVLGVYTTTEINIALGNKANSTHSHGQILSTGAINYDVGITIASGDRFAVVDVSDSSKLKASSLAFGTSTDYALTNKGTWVQFAAASHGTHVTYGTSATAIGTAAAGSANSVSRSDHVHNISLATGDSNGQVKIAGTNVSVKGLDAAAYISTPISAANGGTGTTTLTLAGKAILNALETGAEGYHPAQDVYMLTQDSGKSKFVKRTIGDVFGSLNSTNITTALGYTPANDTEVAKLNVANVFTKSQVISGQGLNYIVRSSTVVSGSTPSSDTTIGYVSYQDKNGNSLGVLRSVYYSSGAEALIFQAQRRKNSTTTNTYMNYIVLGNNESGGAYVTLHSPTAWRTALGLGTSGALPITITQGGTNATSVAGARKNLGYLGMSFSESYNSSEYTTISSNVNLNTATYLTTGKYICTSNTAVGTLTNCPTNRGFQMLVYDFIGEGGAIKSGVWQSRVRILMNYQGEIYIQGVERSGANAYTWGAWKKITTT